MYKRLISTAVMLAFMLSFIFGGINVSADGVNAEPIDFGDVKHVSLSADQANAGTWFEFTPPVTGHYSIKSINNTSGDPRGFLYDSEQDKLTENDDSGGGRDFRILYYMIGGQTYYIRAFNTASGPSEFDVIVEYGVAPGVTGADTDDRRYMLETLEVITHGGQYTLEAITMPADDHAFSFEWFYNNAKLDNTGNTLTTDARSGVYRCNIRYGDDMVSLKYEISCNFNLRFEDDRSVEYLLVDQGESFDIAPAYTIDSGAPDLQFDIEPIFAASSSDRNDFFEGTRPLTLIPGQGVRFDNGLDSYFSFLYELYGDGFGSSKMYKVFVIGDEVDGILHPGDTVHIDQEYILDRSNWSDTIAGREFNMQRIYSFTPQTDGTAGIEIKNIESGVPDIAVFDSDHDLIAQDGGGDIDTWRCADRASLSVPMIAGNTYYICVPVMCELIYMEAGYAITIGADLDLSLTFTEGSVVTGTPTGSPTGAPTSAPTGDPTGNPTSAPTTAPTGNPTAAPTAVPTAAPTNNPPPPDAPVVSSRNYNIGDFVERLYTVALGRSSDPIGKQDWIDAVTLRGQTGADLARGFLYSPEFLQKNVSNEDFVKVLYRTFFDREADAEGLAGWVLVLDNGGSKESVIEGFINSTEWANLCLLYGVRCGGTGTPSVQVEPNQATIDFATRLYTTCLNRSADEAGLMAWARQLANQRDTGTGAARGFFFSSEFTSQNVSNGEYVTRLYRTFMGREPDQAGYDAWVSQLDSGVSREEVFNGFAGSSEFGQICASYGIIR